MPIALIAIAACGDPYADLPAELVAQKMAENEFRANLTVIKAADRMISNANEIRYGDNDRLAARVATMASADLLILLSDIDGLYDAPPASNANAKHIPLVPRIDAAIEAMAGDAASSDSRGGMRTKIEAGKIATTAGTHMGIASGHGQHPLAAIAAGVTGMLVVQSGDRNLTIYLHDGQVHEVQLGETAGDERHAIARELPAHAGNPVSYRSHALGNGDAHAPSLRCVQGPGSCAAPGLGSRR